MSRVLTLAESIKAGITAHNWNRSFACEVRTIPILELESITGLTVSVIPRSVKTTLTARNLENLECVIDIGVQQHAGSTDAATLTNIGSFVDDLRDYLIAKNMGDFHFVKIENDPIYIMHHLINASVFTSILSLTYWLMLKRI